MLAHSLLIFAATVAAQLAPGSGPDPPQPKSSAAPGPWTAGSSGASLTGFGRTLHATSADDFCLLFPPDPTKENMVQAEADAVAYCLNATNTTRPMPDGLILSAHFRTAPDYVAVSGTFDPYRIGLNTTEGFKDCGSEFDGHGAAGVGNPVGLGFRDSDFTQVFQFAGLCQEVGPDGSPRPWGTFCLRLCRGPNAYAYCDNKYDLLGCPYVQPFGTGYSECGFNDCATDENQPVVYTVNGSASTFVQGQSTTPAPPPAPSSSQCTSVASPTRAGVTYPWDAVGTSVTLPCGISADSPNSGYVVTATSVSATASSGQSQLPTAKAVNAAGSIGPALSLLAVVAGFALVLA